MCVCLYLNTSKVAFHTTNYIVEPWTTAELAAEMSHRHGSCSARFSSQSQSVPSKPSIPSPIWEPYASLYILILSQQVSISFYAFVWLIIVIHDGVLHFQSCWIPWCHMGHSPNKITWIQRNFLSFALWMGIRYRWVSGTAESLDKKRLRIFQPILEFLSAIGGKYGNYERGYPQVLNGLVLNGFIWWGFCQFILAWY